MDLFKLDPGLAIWTWIVFGLLFFILSKYALPNLLKNIKDRENIIAKSLDDAAEIDRRLKVAQAEYREILAKARNEADELLRKTRSDAENLRAALLNKAEEEVQVLLAQGRAQMAEEKKAAFEQLRSELADLVCDGAEKLVSRSFTEEEDRQWARELVRTL